MLKYITKIHTPLFVLLIFFSLLNSTIKGQSCNGLGGPISSGDDLQLIGNLCAPSQITYKVWFYNVDAGTPVNSSSVSFEILWGDGKSDILTYGAGPTNVKLEPTPRQYKVSGITHQYPIVSTQCSYDIITYLRINGVRCTNAFKTNHIDIWDTDNEGSGQLRLSETVTSVVNYQICEGENATITFTDRTIFNCLIAAGATYPNTETRWIQFHYGTGATTDRIPGVVVNTKQVTDNLSGNLLNNLNGDGTLKPYYGAVDVIPSPTTASGRNTLQIKVDGAKTIGKAGKTFEITLRNWNFCNPYDADFDGVHPLNGDSLPKTITALITIIQSPPAPNASNKDICFGENRTLTASANLGGTLRWYNNATKTTLLTTGTSYTPTSTAAGNYTFYVTETLGTTGCEGPTKAVTLKIREALSVTSLVADAGDDAVCQNETDAKYIAAPPTPITNPVGGAASYTWSTTASDWSAPSTANIQSYTIGTSSGTKVVTASLGYTTTTTAGSKCPATRTLNVLVNALPTANFGDSQKICYNTKPIFRISSLTGSGNYNATYKEGATTYSFNSGANFTGTRTFTHPNNLTPAGTREFYMNALTDVGTGCVSTYSSSSVNNKALVTIRESLNMPDVIGGSSPVCATENNFLYPTSSTQFPSQPIGGATRYRWQLNAPFNGWTFNDGTTADKLNPTDNNMYYNSGTGTGSIQVRLEYTTAITADPANFCRSSARTKSITVISEPVVTIATSTPKICTGSKPSLTLNISGGVAPYEIKYKQGATTYTLTGINTTSYTFTYGTALTSASVTNYTFEVTSVKSETSPFCVGTVGSPATVDVAVYANPSGSITPDSTICVGESAAIRLVSSGTGPFDFELKNLTAGTTTNLTSKPSGYQHNVSPAVTTNYQLVSVKMTNSPNCSSLSGSSVTFTVNPPPTTANAGVDRTLCGPTSFILEANTPIIGTGAWEVVSKPSGATVPIIAPNPNATIAIGVNMWGDYVLRWKISQISCSPSTDEVKITFGKIPPDPDAGLDEHTCFPNYTLKGSATTFEHGEWTAVKMGGGAGSANFDDNSSNISDVTVTEAGQYKFYWTVKSGSCTPKVDSVLITFDPKPTINAIPNDTICQTQSTKSLSVVSSSNIDTVYWDKFGGSATGYSNPSIPNPVYTIQPADITAGYVNLIVHANGILTCNNDSATDTVKLIIHKLPTISAGSDTIICGKSTPLKGSKNFGNGKWAKLSGTGTVSYTDETNPITNATVGTDTTYRLKWTVTNGECVVRDTVSIRFFENPNGAILSSSPVSVCGLSTTLTATPHNYAGGSNDNGGSSRSWSTFSGSAVAALPSASASTAITVPSYSNYTFRWTETNGACTVNKDVTYTFNKPPTANPTNAIVCEGSSIPLDGSPTKGTGNITTHLWSGATSIFIPSDLTVQKPNVKNTSAPAIYNLKYKVTDDKTCADSANITVTVNALASITTQPVNDTICEGETAQFNIIATASTTIDYQWQIFNAGLFTDISGATTSSLSISGGNDGARYRCRLTTYSSCEKYSNEVILKENRLATIISQPTGKTICEGVSTNFTITATGVGLTYQWQVSTTASPAWQNVPLSGVYVGGTTSTLNLISPAIAMNNNHYRCVLTTTGGCTIISNDVPLTIHANPSIITQPTDKETCENTSTFISLSASGPGLKYKWQIKSGAVFVDIIPTATFTGDTINTLSIANAGLSLDNSIYRCKLTTTGGCQLTSNSAILDVTPRPSVSAGDPGEVCSNMASYTIKASAGANASNYSIITWSSSSGGSFVNSHSLLTTYNLTAADQNAVSVTLTLTALGNGSCLSTQSQMSLSVTPAPMVNAGIDGETCENDTFSLSNSGPSASQYASLLWIHSGTGSLSNSTELTPTYTPSNGETGTRVLTLQAFGNGSCAAATNQMQLVITPKPITSVGSNASTCAGTAFVLSNSITPPTASEYSSLSWSFSNGSGSLSNANTLSPVYSSVLSDANKLISLSLIANGKGSCPSSAPKTMQITVKPIPLTDPITGPTNFCVSSTKVYRTDLPSGTPLSTYAWGVTSITNAPDVGLFNNTAILDFNANAYSGRLFVVETNNGCNGDTSFLTIRSYSQPIIEAGASRTFCNGSSDTLGGDPTATAGSGNFNYVWAPATGLNNPLISNPVASPSGTTQYTLSVSDNISGCSSVIDNVTIFVNPIPSAPGVSDKSACFMSTIPSLDATGSNIKWYNASQTVLLHSGNSFNTGETAVGTYEYYATQTIDGCTSPAAKVTLTIHPVPAAPVAANKRECEGNVIPSLTATGTNIKWYTNIGLTLLAAAGNTYNTGKSQAGVYTYYVTQSANNCASNSTLVSLTIYAPPSAPITGDITVCANQTIPPLTATGDSVNWYSNVELTNHKFLGNSYNTGNTAAGSYMYYATQTKNACRSASSSATLTINSIPAITNVTSVPQTVCNSSDASITITATGTAPLSYSIDGGTNYVSNNIFGNLGQGTYPIKVKNGFNCFVTGSNVVIQHGDAPPPPIANNNRTYCEKDNLSLMTASGHAGGLLIWYSDAALAHILDTASTWQPAKIIGTTTYYVTETKDTCESASTPSVITINATPIKPVVSDKTVCQNEVATLTATGTNLKWYNNASATGTPLATGAAYTPSSAASGVFTFYVTQTVNSCTSEPEDVVLTVNAIPDIPGGSNQEVCAGLAVPALTAEVGAGSTVRWYNDAALTSPANTGNPFNTGRTAVGVYNYYVIQEIAGCKSASKNLRLTIALTPDAPVANDIDTCAGVKLPILKVSGLTNAVYSWYSDSTLKIDSLKNQTTSTTFNTGKNAVGNYSYWVTQSIGNCTSVADKATLRIHSIPSAPIATDKSSCFGMAVPNLTVSGVSGVSFTWYSGAKKFFGDNLATGKTVVGTYPYSVTQTLNGCESPETDVNLIVRPNPKHISNTPTHETYCNMNNGQINVSATFEVNALELPLEYSKNNGLNYSATNQFISLPDGFYFIKIRNVYGCVTDGGTVTINPGGPPPAPVASGSKTYCKGDALTNLTATATLTGGVLIWYNELLDSIGTGNAFTPFDIIGTRKYYVTETFGGCEGPSTELIVTINAIPAAPVLSNASICNDDAVPTLTATGSNINWYSALPGTILNRLALNINTYKPTSYTTVNTHQIYATQTILGCESPADTSFYTIKPIPDTLVVNNVSVCYGLPVPNLVSSAGTSIKWYSNQNLSTQVNSGTVYNTGKTQIGQYKYFITQTVNACVSVADSAILSIDSVPPAPFSSNEQDCENSLPYPYLKAYGQNLKWYVNADLSDVPVSADSILPPTSGHGNYVRFVTQTIGICQGPATSDTLRIIEPPANPLVADTATCFGTTIPLLTATGTKLRWYSLNKASLLCDKCVSFDTKKTATGEYPFLVTQSDNFCESDTVRQTLTIHALPVIYNYIAEGEKYCNTKDGSIAINADTEPLQYSINNGVSYQADSFFLNLTNGAYAITVKDANGCIKNGGNASVSPGNTPPAPQVSPDTMYCLGESIANISATGVPGGKLRWYANAALTQPIGVVGATFISPANTVGIRNYYVYDSIGTCKSPSSVSKVSINALPTGTTAGNAQICEGDYTVLTFTFTGKAPFTFTYSNGIDAATNTTSNNPHHVSVSSAGYYKITQLTDANGCTAISFGDSALIVVNALPTASLSGSAEICDDGSTNPIQFDFTGTAPYFLKYALNTDTFSINNIGSNIYTLNANEQGTYQTISLYDSNGCVATDLGGDATLVVLELPSGTFSGSKNLCNDLVTPAVLNVDLTGSLPCNFTYTVNGATPVTRNTSSNSNTITTTGEGEYRLTNITDANGCSAIDLGAAAVISRNPLPTATFIAPDSICDGDSVKITVSFTGKAPWRLQYSVKGIMKPIIDSIFNTPFVHYVDTNLTNINYKIESVRDDHGCTAKTPIADKIIKVNPNPDKPIGDSTNLTECNVKNGSIDILSSDPLPLYFSITDTASSSFQLNNSFFDLLGLGTYPIIVKNIHGCITFGDSVDIVSETFVPAKPFAGASQTICFGEPLDSLWAEITETGTFIGFNWYYSPYLSNSIATNTSWINPRTDTIGAVNYYVTQVVDTCESLPVKITVTINPLPAKPIAADDSSCFTGNAKRNPFLIGAGTRIKWYEYPNLDSIGVYKQAFQSSETVSGNYNYFITQSEKGCESPFDTVGFRIKPTVPAPLTLNENVCGDNAIPQLRADTFNIRWYNDYNARNFLASGNLYNTNKTLAGTYNYYATQTFAGCEGITEPASLIIRSKPALPKVSDILKCEGEFIPAFKASGGIDFVWYNAIFDSIGSGNVFDHAYTEDSVAGVYVFYVTQLANGCESDFKKITLTIKSKPATPILDAINPYCKGSLSPILKASNIETGATVAWYRGITKTALQDDKISTYATTDVEVGTYNYSVNQKLNGCESDRAYTSFTIMSVPVFNSFDATDESFCNKKDGQISIDATDIQPLEYSIDSGLTFSDEPIFENLASGSYQIVLRNLNLCSAMGPLAVIGAGGPPPAPVVSPDKEYCFGESISKITATPSTGGFVTWYSDIALNDSVGAGNLYTPLNTVGKHVYYATETSGQCESPAAKVTVSINAIPPRPVGSDVSVCYGEKVPFLNASGAHTINWYSAGTLKPADFITSGSTYITVQTKDSTYHFYINQVSNKGCTSSSDTVTLVIHPIPEPPLDNLVFACTADPIIPDLYVDGSNILWYGTVNKDTLIGSGNSYKHFKTLSAVYTFFATQTVNGCQSEVSTQQLRIKQTPEPPAMQGAQMCKGNDIEQLIADGEHIKWYNSKKLLDSETNYYTPKEDASIPKTFTYYATQSVNGCESARDSALLVINPVPEPPVTHDTSVCYNATIPFLEAIGNNIKWYADINVAVFLVESAEYDTKQGSRGQYSYFATQTINGCESEPAQATLIINNIPRYIKSTLSHETYCKMADGTITINAINPTGTSILEYSADNGNTFYANSGVFTNLKNGTYYIVVRNASGCEVAGDTLTIKAGVAPPAPSAGPEGEYCEGQIPDSIEAIPTLDISKITWYRDQALTDTISTETTIQPFLTTGITQYYATQTVNGCESPSRLVTTSIFPKPDAPLVKSDTFCANEIIPDLVAKGSNIVWYNDSTLTEVKYSGERIRFNQEPNSYLYYVTQTINGCESDYSEASMVINEVPELEVPNATTEGCPPLQIILSASHSNADNIRWYIDSDISNQITDIFFDTLENASSLVRYYRIKTVASTNEGCEKIVTNDIKVFPAPDFDFEPAPAEMCSPARFQFISKSGGLFKWEYGDGAIDETTSPVVAHGYAADPIDDTTLNVRLIATSDIYNCTDTFEHSVVIYPSAKPNFSLSANAICAPDTIIFTNISTNAQNSWWKYGDGSAIDPNNAASVSHLYENKGLSRTDKPELRIETEFGCIGSISKSVLVKPEVLSDFARDSAGCAPFPVTFNNLTNGSDYKSTWDFGDGMPGNTDTHTSHAYYNDGSSDLTFNAKLNIVSKEGCSDSIMKNIVVYPTLHADFEPDTDVLCQPHIVLINNKTKGACANCYQWTFGDGLGSSSFDTIVSHRYVASTAPIDYKITLQIRNSTNICYDTVSHVITVNPALKAIIAMEDSVCAPFTASYKDETVGDGRRFYEWNFDDGNSSIAPGPTNIFLNSSTEAIPRNVSLKITSEYGCEHDTSRKITIYPAPEANFRVNPGQQRFPEALFEFTDATNAGPWKYLWEFGDGKSDTTKGSTQHEYATWGNKSNGFKIPVKLTTLLGQCSDSAIDTLILYPPLPIADFNKPLDSCAARTVNLISSSQNATEYFWDFGDGSAPSTDSAVTHTYNEPGAYKIELTVNGDGGTGSKSEILIVHPNPVAAFEVYPYEIMLPDDVIKCYNLSTDGKTYIWYFGDGNTSTELSPKYKYKDTGQYIISLKVISPHECTDSIGADTVVTVSANGTIRYPNAFFPSMAGPQTGGASSGQNPNSVFRPVVESVKEYHFEIYNRWGARVFATDNINVGWDGYHDGKVCPQDVYVFKAWGKFHNNKTFIKKGDITLLHRNK